MYQALFRSWKFAALWAIGISASIAAFFADGGGHEQFEQSAQQIREKRSNTYREDAQQAQPAAQPTAAATPPPPTPAEEASEPEFGEPMMDTGEGEGQEEAPAEGPARP